MRPGVSVVGEPHTGLFPRPPGGVVGCWEEKEGGEVGQLFVVTKCACARPSSASRSERAFFGSREPRRLHVAALRSDAAPAAA